MDGWKHSQSRKVIVFFVHAFGFCLEQYLKRIISKQKEIESMKEV